MQLHQIRQPGNSLLNRQIRKTISIEIFFLQGFYATYIGSLLPTFRDNLSVPIPRIAIGRR
jgi:hypothetical protein